MQPASHLWLTIYLPSPENTNDKQAANVAIAETTNESMCIPNICKPTAKIIQAKDNTNSFAWMLMT